MTKITENFSEQEFTRSETAVKYNIDNSLTEPARRNIKILCENYLEPIRKYFREKVHASATIMITSGYRCPELNRKTGGSVRSAHMSGQAADFHIKINGKQMNITESYNFIYDLIGEKKLSKPDQLIWEYGTWMHLGIREPLLENRGQFLLTKGNGKYDQYKRF